MKQPDLFVNLEPERKLNRSLMQFISPMLAKVMPDDFDPESDEGLGWTAEEKYDGHRITTRVIQKLTKSWSRYGRERTMPDHIVRDLKKLPDCYLDGELVDRKSVV